MRQKEEVPVSQFRSDEPRFATYNGTGAIFLSDQVAKINYRYGNDIDGWRYELEYKNGEKRYPPTFLVEEKTEAEYTAQENIPYEPKTWKHNEE